MFSGSIRKTLALSLYLKLLTEKTQNEAAVEFNESYSCRTTDVFTVKHFSKRLHLLKKPVTNLHKSICVINTNTADLGFKHEKI